MCVKRVRVFVEEYSLGECIIFVCQCVYVCVCVWCVWCVVCVCRGMVWGSVVCVCVCVGVYGGVWCGRV